MGFGHDSSRFAVRLAWCATALLGFGAIAAAATFTLFDRTFTRSTGQPQTVTVSLAAPATTYMLRVESDGVASAVITLNSRVVVGPRDFNNNVRLIQRPVTLQPSNQLSVEVRGAPGGSLRLIVAGQDDDPPAIRAATLPAPNAAGWNNTDVTVTFTCSDPVSGVQSCPPPVVVSAEGAQQVISGDAIDHAGNRARASVTLNIDKTAPTIAPAYAPLPNAEGWHRTDVSAGFACADALSGIAECTAPRPVTAEGASQAVPGRAVDRAGNAAIATGVVNVDKSAPRISATLSAPPNAEGWHAAPVTVTFACEDAGSGVASCPSPVVVSGEGAAQAIRGLAHDRAGNSAGAIVTVNLDLTAPRITAALSELANAAGWHRRDVTVTFTCADDVSGVTACPAPQVVSTEGARQPVSATITNRAGHPATAAIEISLDRTAPTIASAVEPLPNDAGWHRTPVTVSFTCADSGSGIASCTEPVTITEPGSGRRIDGVARDQAGNEARTGVTLDVDLTPPAIRAVPSAGGLTNTDVTVTFVCEDLESGMAACPAPVVVTAEGLNQVVEGIATDRAGNSSRATVSISIDRTKPTIVATLSPAANAAGWHRAAAVVVTFTCDDTGSGVASCQAPVEIPAEGLQQVVTGTATDRAGNVATVSLTVSVDRTPPGIGANVSHADWTNTDASVYFVCTDALSGIAFCTATIGARTDGIHELTGAAVDLAGNSATASATLRVDKTAPTIHAAAGRAPNTAGWYNAPVSVAFVCADTLSGVVNCPAAVTASTEGANQPVTGSVTDRAGNSASTSLDVSIDTTAPTIRALVGEGWIANDTIVSFECADTDGSGVATCPAQIPVRAEGATVVRGTATDVAGNSAAVEGTVRVDKTPPTIAATANRPPNAQGWYSQPVRVEFQCADAVSSVASCPVPVDVTVDGANQTITGTAVDAAGNAATVSLTLNLDTTPPSIVPQPSPAGAWSNGPVTVTFVCADATSGVASCPQPQVLSSDGAGQAVAGEAVDLAGNRASASASVNIDRAPPTIAAAVAPAPNARGWHRADATVTFQCADAASGIADCPPPVVVSAEGAGQQVSGGARDVAGNAATTSATVNLDRTPPALAIASPTPGTVLRTATTIVTGSVADTMSGPLSVGCGAVPATLTSGAFSCTVVLTNGANTIEMTATDAAGNVAQVPLAIVFNANTAPVARAGGPYAAETGAAIRFDGSASSDPEEQALTYAWTFGDGQAATGATPSHTYQDPGTYSVELTVRDTEGATNTASATATIARANRPPVADAGGPYAGDAARTITFSGAASGDPDGDPLTYAWNFGDGTSGSGAVVRRSYSTPGNYTATLTVADARGAAASATAAVTVRPINQRPTAIVGGPYSGEAGVAVAFSGAGSTDPDKDPLTHTWSFGDGGAGSGATLSHGFAAPGIYTVTLTVNDGRGGTHSASAQAAIAAANRPPIARLDGPSSGEAGATLAFSGAQSSDPDGDLLTFAWLFGDGRSATGPAASRAYATAGTYTVTLTVNDGRGGTQTATRSVTVTPAPAGNRPPVANVGGPYSGEVGLPVTFDGSASNDPDQDAISYAWDFGDGSSAAGPNPSHAYAEARAYAVTLTVTDAGGATSSGAALATVGAPVDRSPPVVTLSGPRDVLPGTTVTVRAQASDNSSVSAVTFEVNGVAGAPLAAPPYERQVAVPAVAAPGDRIMVRAIARDPAGNAATAALGLTITSQPDNENPAIALKAPAQAAPGGTVRFSAAAFDNDGVASVIFSIEGVPLLTDTDEPFEAAYAVPADAAVGSSFQILAQAVDHTGNRATDTAAVTIAATPDTTAPTVRLTAPVTVAPGGTIPLTADAADASGISAVVFTVDGAHAGTDTEAPYEASYTVPASAIAGMTFRSEARAIDFAGLEGADTKQTVLATPSVGEGFILGEIYNDDTGLPMAGARAVLARGSLAPGQAPEVLSDERGRFVIRALAGEATVRISAGDFTGAERGAMVQAGSVAELLDARLTPSGDIARDVPPVLGGTLQSGRTRLDIPAGALFAPARIVLATPGPQGLESPLPAGWSPIAIADIAPRATAFVSAATLRWTFETAPAAGSMWTLVRWDADARGWRAVAQATADGSSTFIEAPVDAAGQYAWIQADTVPAAPPAPAIGELIAGTTHLDIPDGALTAITPDPKVIFYQPGVHSSVTGVLTTPAPLPSGTRLWARIAESYRFYSGAQIHTDAMVQDLVLYQSQPDALKLGARFIASPSRRFEALTLDRGVISLELYAPPSGGGAPVAMISAQGGFVTAPTGERFDLPASAVAAPLTASLRRLTADELGLPMPGGIEFVGAVELALDGAPLNGSGVLSIPKPAGLADGAPLLVARIATLRNRSRLVLVALARVDADRVISDAMLPLNQVPMEGARTSGRFVFLRPASPIGFFTGRVITASGDGFAGAQVSADPFPVVALSRAAGTYVAAALVGDVTLNALDLQTSDTGSAAATLTAAGQEQALDLRLLPEPPRVTSVTPASGARNVPVSTPVVVVFSEPIDPATVSGTGAGNVALAATGGNAVAASLALAGGNTVLTFRPTEALEPNTSHTFTLAAGVQDVSGHQLGAPLVVEFMTLDTTAPLPPAAGTVTATIPDASGTTTVRGAQGTAGLHDTVTVENLTRGTSTPALLDPNGGFLVLVQASPADALKLKIVDQAGNETLVDVPGFTRENPDGSISGVVKDGGGRINGPNGTAVDVPAGSLPPGTIVTIKAILENDFPVQLAEDQKQYFDYSGGVQVDFGGVTPSKYVNVSVPARAGDTPDDQWVVASVIDVAGQQVLNAVDTAKLINGRVQTSSPPCPGVLAAGVYGVYKSAQPLGLAWGRMYQNGSYDGLRMTVHIPPMLAGIAMPYPVYAWENPLPICLPMITGRVTVGPNTVRIGLKPEALTPADREIIVRNINNGRESHFRRDVLEYAFEVVGPIGHDYRAVVVSPSGAEVPITAIDVQPAQAGKVRVSLDADSIPVAVSEVVITDVTAVPNVATRFPRQDVLFDLHVGGGTSDAYWVTVVDSDGVSRRLGPSLFDMLPSSHGPGNLLARAIPKTIDPTLAEIDRHNAGAPPDKQLPTDKYRVGVDLITTHDGATTSVEIPADLIVNGGFAYAFEGEDSAAFEHAVQVRYNTGETEYVRIHRLRFVVQNAQTGRVIRTIEVQAPPRDEPMSVGVITDDTQPPLLTGSPTRMNSFDPASPLTFTFSEPMNADSIKQGAIVERIPPGGGRERVAGDWRVHGQNRTATFVPLAPLRIGEEYSITFIGADALGRSLGGAGGTVVSDYGGNGIATMRLQLKTFTPRIVSKVDLGANGRPMDEIRDIRIRRKVVAGKTRTFLFATTNAWDRGPKFLSFDVTDVDTPKEIGFAYGGRFQKELTLVPDIGTGGNPPLQFREAVSGSPAPCGGNGASFTGDLAISTAHNVDFSMVQVWDVRNPAAPCMVTSKLLTANPDTINSYTRPGTVHAVGFSDGIAALRHSTGVAAYTAIRGVGLMVTDVGQQIPERTPGQREKDAFAPGDYWDVVAVRDHLVAVDFTERTLDIFDPNLAQVATVALPKQPRELVVAENYAVDEDGDGFIRPNEIRDLAFVATRDCPTGAGCSNAIYVVDLKGLARPEVIGWIDMPGSVFELDIDPEKQRLFASGHYGGGTSSSAFFIIDISRPTAFAADRDGDGLDDRIVWRKEFGGLNAPRVDKERGLAYLPVVAEYGSRLGRLEIWALYDNCCDLGVDFTAGPRAPPTGDRDGLLRKEREALRTGIASGLAKAATQCGLSPSSISILEQGSGACLWRGRCDDNYQPGLSDHDFEVFFPEASFDAVAKCTVKEFNGVFTDPRTGEPKDITLPSGGKMAFEDITFFPEVRERFETARFDVEPPDSSGSDAVGDLGLGRRSLLLKWLLEGAYVTSVPGYSVAGRSLDLILNDLKAVTGIPRLEGYEWAVLQDFALAKSKAFLRIKGAAKPGSAFHKLFVKQAHDAGKAGIRATMGRLVSDPIGNSTVLDITREWYDTNACYEITVTVTNPRAWPAKPCSSFEEYVASAAARTLRDNRGLFSFDDIVNKVHRFFRVKSDRERIVAEPAADKFIAMTSQFITATRVAAQPVYDLQLPSDPDRSRRTANMSTAAVELNKALTAASLPLTPHVFNHGFRDGAGLRVAMYKADTAGAGVFIKETTVDLSGGDERYLSYLRNPDGTLALANGRAQPIFKLGVDLTANLGQPHGVSFVIDLPDRTMKESNRLNNVGGFFYYVLDRSTGGTPAAPAEPPMPLPGTGLLDPNPECYDTPTLVTTQFLSVGGVLIGDQAILGRGEAVTIQLTVQNLSSETMNDVLACSNITNQCYPLGTLVSGASRTHLVDYVTPMQDRYIDGTPSAFSPGSGVITGAATRLIVSGDAYAIQPLMDKAVVSAIDDKLLGIEAGGTLHRHYRIVGKRSSQPKPGMTVTGEIEGIFGGSGGATSKKPLAFTTNPQGEICVAPCTADNRGLTIPYDPQMITNTTYFVTLKQVNRTDISPENHTAFQFDVSDRSWSQSYSVGGSIGGGVKILAGAGLEFEDGFELSKSGGFFTGPKELGVSLSRQVTARSKTEADIGFNIKTPIIAAKAELKGGVSGSAPVSFSDGFSFPYVRNADTRPGAPPFILEWKSHCAIADLTMRFLSNRNPLVNKLANLLREQPCGDPQEFAKTHGVKGSVSRTASAGLDVGFQSPIFGRAGNERPTVGVSVGRSATGSVSVEHETSYGINATTRLVEATGSKTAIGLFGQIELTASFGASLQDTFRRKKPGVTPSADDEREDKFALKTIEKALKRSASSVTGGAFSLELEQDKDGVASRMGLGFSRPKEFGWSTDAGGGGAGVNLGSGIGSSVSLSITRPADMQTAADRLASLKQMATALVNAGPTAELTLTPTKLNDEIEFFRTLLFDTVSTYQVTNIEGSGVELPLGFEGKLKGIGFNVGLSFKGDAKSSFAAERGVNFKGRMLPLQTYTRDAYLPANDLGLRSVIGQIWESIDASFGSEFSYVGANITPGTTVLKSTRTATMTIDGSREPEPFAANLYSYSFTPIAGPVEHQPYRPADTSGPAGAPHYGIGSFHHFMPHNRQLAAPAPLVIDYRDDEVVGLDESTLAIYAWNEPADDWEFIGGTVDPAANTVTTTVDRLRAYTLAPAMPARTITFTRTDDGGSGTGETATQRFTVTSGTLVMNNGQPVSDGTFFTVRSVLNGSSEKVAFGAVLTADADPGREHVQVPVVGGRIQFQVEFTSPGNAYLPGRVIVWSAEGTAYGEMALRKEEMP